GADSLDTVELVMALEEEFETEIPDEEAEKITTVQQAIAYILAKKNESYSPPGTSSQHSPDQRTKRVAKRRVVVTGLGLSSPVGNSVSEGWRNVREGKSGIRPIEAFDVEAFTTRFAGTIVGFDVTQYMEPKEARKC